MPPQWLHGSRKTQVMSGVLEKPGTLARVVFYSPALPTPDLALLTLGSVPDKTHWPRPAFQRPGFWPDVCFGSSMSVLD
jgi:hypothetical protein